MSIIETATVRSSLLIRALESFTETLDLTEVMKRVTEGTLDEFEADRAFLLAPVGVDIEFTTAMYEATRPGFPGAFELGVKIPLTGSRKLIERSLRSPEPVAVYEDDPDLDPVIKKQFNVRSQLIQPLRAASGELWAFGLHQCSHRRVWTTDQIALFGKLGRYAEVAIRNALIYRRAIEDAAKLAAILDQIPEAAAIYDGSGVLDRMNVAAQRESAHLFGRAAEERLALSQHRRLDGSALTTEELPSVRALRGEVVDDEYMIRDGRSGADRVVNMKAAPIRGENGDVIGSVVLSRDTTEEHSKSARDVRRRRRAEALANVGFALVGTDASTNIYQETVDALSKGIGAHVSLYVYSRVTDTLDLAGARFTNPAGEAFAEYARQHPFKPGEGLPGTVFQLARPLIFSEPGAVLDYARNDQERALKQAIEEQSVIAVPIESYGELIGALVLSSSAGRMFDAEDLEFAKSIADRIGAVTHIRRLSQVAQEGHRAAEELAREEVNARVRFEAVLESAPIAIAVISADELRFELANTRWIDVAARTGRISPDTRVVGLRLAEVNPELVSAVEGVAEAGEPHTAEAQELVIDGRTHYFNTIISPVSGRFSGAIQSITVLVQDVTEQVRATREIEALARMMAERSARLDSILGSMTDGLWVFDAMSNVVDVNPAALALFGIGSRSEAVANASFEAFDLRYPDGRKIPAEDLPVARALRGEVVPDYLATGRHLITQTDIDLSIATAPIESNGIVGAVLVIRDITALQELDRKKDEFLSVASHELRTPLTTIKGYTQLLAQTIEDLSPEDRATYFAAVLGEIDRMMGLIAELLDVSRIETNRLEIHREPVSWLAFIDRLAYGFRVQHPSRQITFESDIPDLQIEIDPHRMRQVVDNLLSNALKYSPEGTDIRIRVSRYDDRIDTSIEDHGIGIPRDEIPHLFERFHRARNVSSRYYGGLGLGLYIAKAIVEAHRGAIQVDSSEGQGSRFTISLPAPEQRQQS